MDKTKIHSLIRDERWQEARGVCARFCNIKPDDAEGWFLLGAICGQLGAFRESEDACVRSLALRGDMPITLCNLGIAQREQGKLEAAIDVFKKAIKLKPDLSEAYAELGAALRLRGDFDEGASYCRHAISLKPSNATALYNLALILSAKGNTSEAMLLLQQAISVNPKYADAHLQFGQMLRACKRLDEAIVHFRRAIALRPIDAIAWNALGGAVMTRLGAHYSLGEPEKCYREAIRLQPAVPEFYLNLGVLLREQGRHTEALELFRKAVEVRPDYEAAIAGVAQVLEHLGDFDGAYAAIQPLLKRGTEESSVALAYSSVARHLNQCAESAALLEKIVLLPKPARESSSMHFALGKLYDAMKEYDKSFSHTKAAHEVEPAHYDPEINRRKFDEIIEVFSAENFARWPRAANKSQLPVFIVGMPRSGTSLVEQILASHPQVHGAGELEHVHGMTATLATMLGNKIAYPQCLTEVKRKHLDEIAQRHLAMLSKLSKTAARVTDKMPHNFIELGLINLLFPEARIIHCKRDPVDTCFSIYGLPFNDSHPYAGNLEHLGSYYLQYLRLMEHWKSVLSVPILEVQYEGLVADQEGISRQMIEFCGLHWDERCLNFHKADRVVTTHSYDQVRRPIYKQSVARWKNYERHLGPLIEVLESPSYSHSNVFPYLTARVG